MPHGDLLGPGEVGALPGLGFVLTNSISSHALPHLATCDLAGVLERTA